MILLYLESPVQHQKRRRERRMSEKFTTNKDTVAHLPPNHHHYASQRPGAERDSFLDKVNERLHIRSRSASSGLDSIGTEERFGGLQKRATSSTTSTDSSIATSTSSGSRSAPKSSTKRRPSKPNQGNFTECGRHSNEWLFNNFSITGAVKDLLDRRNP